MRRWETGMPVKSGWRGALLLALSFLAFLPALRAGFLWDDVSIYLLENPLLRAPQGLFRIWFTSQPIDYYPVTHTLYWLEWRAFGTHPLGYHIVQLGLHAAVAVLVWRALVALLVPGAWFAAALFAVHPLNVETAAWISQTKGTLSLALSLAALLAFLRFDQERRRPPYVAALLLFVAAILAKTSAVVLPGVLLGSLWWRRRRLTASDVRVVAPFVGVALLLGVVGMSFQARTSGAAEAAAEPWVTRLVAAGWIPWFYLFKTIWPVGLALVYPRWNVNPAAPLAWVPGLALIAVLGLAWWRRASWGAPVIGALGYFLFNLAPVLGFIGIGFMAHARVADHWCYAALPGPLALAAGAAARAVARWRVPMGGRVGWAAVPLVLCTVLSWRQSSLYKDEERLWRDTIAKNPRAWVAHNNLGRALAMRGNLPEAEAELKAALAIAPRYPDALLNLANVLDDQGRTAEALPMYARALEVSPPRADLHYNFGVALEKAGRFAEAAEQYRRVLELAPLDAGAQQRLQAVEVQLGPGR
jgi:hypothetical protein